MGLVRRLALRETVSDGTNATGIWIGGSSGCSAIAEAVAQRRREGGNPVGEIMVPVVSSVQELEHVREIAESVIDAVATETGAQLQKAIGTMIELPRACLTARQIAGAADFFCFGTNDLTQTTWGFSRDDCEASFFPRYMDLGIFGTSVRDTRPRRSRRPSRDGGSQGPRRQPRYRGGRMW